MHGKEKCAGPGKIYEMAGVSIDVRINVRYNKCDM